MDKTVDDFSFKELARQIPYAVVITNRAGEVTWSNPAFYQLCGYTNDELVGKKPGSLLQGVDTDPKTVQALRQAVKKGVPIRTEIINYHKKGHPYWASITITPIQDQNGKVTGFIAVERDTTRRREKIKSLEDQVVELYTVLLSVDQKKGSNDSGGSRGKRKSQHAAIARPPAVLEG